MCLELWIQKDTVFEERHLVLYRMEALLCFSCENLWKQRSERTGILCPWISEPLVWAVTEEQAGHNCSVCHLALSLLQVSDWILHLMPQVSMMMVFSLSGTLRVCPLKTCKFVLCCFSCNWLLAGGHLQCDHWPQQKRFQEILVQLHCCHACCKCFSCADLLVEHILNVN